MIRSLVHRAPWHAAGAAQKKVTHMQNAVSAVMSSAVAAVARLSARTAFAAELLVPSRAALISCRSDKENGCLRVVPWTSKAFVRRFGLAKTFARRLCIWQALGHSQKRESS